ncbi:glutathione peroxidase [Herbaspirillum sp. GW103]|jgi:glutathione peroxidase|uniref:glutathione peroxidase n=1 Tax=unclassified Herbaspirillum TaxID=2624150 RepID=UPI00025E4141|nr:MULTISPECIES: glutathione peroxidase [unclassified Herbaspirillum]EIJ46150.1 glutathione peroxidase [Herbaspirillum sp. GW103]MCI1003554.1 glutathione peroxidase [Herbaspirillum sp. C7C8]
MTTLYDFQPKLADQTPFSLEQLRGKVLLIVNTASKCGFTPQYNGLEAIHRQFHPRGLEVMAFPCNQFGAQEPGNAEEIGAFCEKNYGVSFPLFAKIDVNGEQADPLYQYLKKEAPGLLGSKAIKWNFTKFLVRRDGSVFKRYAPQTRPEEMISDIETLLAE